jgi:hypothetical protein
LIGSHRVDESRTYTDAQALDLAVVPPGEPVKPPPSPAKLAAAAKAREAAAAKRRENGPTPAQVKAMERMQEGAARKRAEMRKVKEGGAVPKVPAVADIEIEPAPYPEVPTPGVDLAPDVPGPSDTLEAEPATATPSHPVTNTKERKPWLKRALGL